MKNTYVYVGAIIAVLAAALVIMAVTFWIRPALAHKAPSGWEYPNDCCSGQECRPIACGLIQTKPDGSADWMGLHFYKNGVRISGDGDCHVCVSYSNDGFGKPIRNGHCIYLSPTN